MLRPAEFSTEEEWKRRLIVTQTHQPRPLHANALIALRDAPAWNGVLAYDEFALVAMAMRPPPWVKTNGSWTARMWTDQDDALACEWLQHQGISVTVTVAAKAAETVAREKAFHPIRDYLDGLRWDGVPRVNGFAHTYLGAGDIKYHKAVGKCMFVSAVARIKNPGCKVDHAVILEGEQGARKSTVIREIFSPWFSDDLAELGTKDSAMQMRVAWGIEIAELASMQRSEIEKVKAFISRQIDIFRPPYGARVIQVPRQSVFVGSTNAAEYIKDETGGRRFWPVACSAIDVDAVIRDKDQLWAEAVRMYDDSTKWWLTDTGDIAAAKTEQEDRRVPDEWEAPIGEYIRGRDDVTLGEILSDVFFIEKAKWTQMEQNRARRCLVSLGWTRGWRDRERCYRPK
jgi:predicted P-loop ATPase